MDKRRSREETLLDDVLSFGAHVAFTLDREEGYPSRPKLRRRLEAIGSAATFLIATLTDTRTFDLLSDSDRSVEDAMEDVRRNLPSIGKATERILARAKPTSGRGRLEPSPDNAPDARQYCALIVSVAWHQRFKEWPGQKRSEAHNLCERLWTMAGGAAHRHAPTAEWASNPGSYTAWQKHLRAAKRYRPPHPAGKLVEHILLAGRQPPARRPSTPPGGRLKRWLYVKDQPSPDDGAAPITPRTTGDGHPIVVDLTKRPAGERKKKTRKSAL